MEYITVDFGINKISAVDQIACQVVYYKKLSSTLFRPCSPVRPMAPTPALMNTKGSSVV
jgi:hypothetical protein